MRDFQPDNSERILHHNVKAKKLACIHFKTFIISPRRVCLYTANLILNLPFVDMVTLYWTVMNNTANFEVTCRKQTKLDKRRCTRVSFMQRSNWTQLYYQIKQVTLIYSHSNLGVLHLHISDQLQDPWRSGCNNDLYMNTFYFDNISKNQYQ